MRKNKILLRGTCLIGSIFLGILLFFGGCTHPSRNTGVYKGQIMNLAPQVQTFYDGTTIEYKLLFDEEDMAVTQYFIKPLQEIPPHYHTVDKVFYVYEGEAIVWVNNELKTAGAGDSISVPKSSVTYLKNNSQDDTVIFLFYPEGPFDSFPFLSPTGDELDRSEAKIKLIQPDNVPWEYWDGVLDPKEYSPVRWKTLVNTNTMVLGITHIDPWHEVDSHYHDQTEIVIFHGGKGITRINDEEYSPIAPNNYIHPSKDAIHHTISIDPDKPLHEIYFFPAGPFSTIKYIYK